jgi:glucoside 3-dehydrogenase (cytochrome c) hitch-hiker subunit
MDDPQDPRPSTAAPAKRLGRRATLKLLGLTLTGAAAAGAASVETEQKSRTKGSLAQPPAKGRAWRYRPLASGETPTSFTAAEFATLTAAVDLIIPDTDTPGARAAGVHWYLDDVARTEAKLRDQLRAGCARLDSIASARHRKPFVHLDAATQTAMLTEFDTAGTGAVKIDNAAQPQVTGSAPSTAAITPDDRSFFSVLKAQTVDAYYKSEMGQLGELEWVGHEFNDEFYGRCTHEDPLVHPRAKWPRARG